MNGPKLTIQVVTWNSAEFLPELLRSLAKQHFRDYHLVIIDNASNDESVELARAMAPTATIIQNTVNKGFAGGHNQGLRIAESPYIALVNPDITFTPDALNILVQTLDEHSDFASVGAKLLKNDDASGIIDCAGILAKRNRRFLNRGEGENDHGQYDVAEDVFGNTGAFVVFRRDALASVRIGDEFLDEDLFAYKEDIDIAWRLLLAGWHHWYEPRAILYHHRAVQREDVSTTLRQGRKKSAALRRLSYRNHLLLLAKNDRLQDWWRPLPWTFFYEIGKAVYLLFREPRTLLGIPDALRLLPRMRKKRAISLRHAKRSPASIQVWFT